MTFESLTRSHRNLLEECVSIAENSSEARGYLARANFKLAELHAKLGNVQRSKACKQAARMMRQEISGDMSMSSDTQEDYDKLVLWMLW